MNQANTAQDTAASSVKVESKPFDPNISGAIARLHTSGGQVVFCDVVILTERDLVVTIPKSEPIPDRGESVNISLFLVEDDTFVARREGVVHWEMALHGERLAGIFLSKSAPTDLLDLTEDDRRLEVRYPANLACRVKDKTNSIDGRLVNYSLNGLATQMSEPMEIGQSYTVELDAGEEQIQVEARCRWSMETAYGFVNGCSLTDGAGQRLARRAFRGSVMPWDINRSRRRAINRPADETGDGQTSNAQTGNDVARPVISNATILLLSAVLIGLSIKTPAHLADAAFFGGLIGMITYIGLSWTARVRSANRDRKLGDAKRQVAETRLEAHVASGASRKTPASGNADK